MKPTLDGVTITSIKAAQVMGVPYHQLYRKPANQKPVAVNEGEIRKGVPRRYDLREILEIGGHL